ncbi:MAG: cadherin-like domain-containing protein, partial [Planctomycetes bacterium]|nr:cadherin-like domain-containing protein [Planctomycetota bacterium]
MKHLAILLTLLLFTSCGSSGDDAGGTTGPPAVTNDPPVASDDTISTPSNTSVLIDVLANDTDPDGDTISLVSLTAPTNGSAVIVNGQIEYTPPASYIGADTFTYTIEDSFAAQATATVYMDVVSGIT